jgi:hypothetical protein
MAALDSSPAGGAELGKLVEAMRMAAAASLANAVILSARRPHSIENAVQVLEDVRNSLWPDSSSGRYQTWKKHFDAAKVHD